MINISLHHLGICLTHLHVKFLQIHAVCSSFNSIQSTVIVAYVSIKLKTHYALHKMMIHHDTSVKCNKRRFPSPFLT